MSETDKIPKLTVRFEHEYNKFPQPYWDTKIAHIPRLDETVRLPTEFYASPCVVENVEWNLGTGAPWHVKIMVTE